MQPVPGCGAAWAGLRIGLLGGSFNPAHAGHRHISLQALKRLRLDAVWWLVSPQNPLKPRAGMAPLARRLAHARQMAAHPRIQVTALETRLGTTYTVDTVAALVAGWPRTRFIWLMGMDGLEQFHRWKDWPRIAGLVPIAVLARPGYGRSRRSVPAMVRLGGALKRDQAARAWTRWELPAIVILTIPLNTTSATAVRRANPDWADGEHQATMAAGCMPNGCMPGPDSDATA